MTFPAAVCFDLPCLVRLPEPVPAEALARALRRLGLESTGPTYDACLATVPSWPGDAARSALTAVLGSEIWGDAAAAAYDDAFGGVVSRHGAAFLPDARELLGRLWLEGLCVGLTTEFSASTREVVLDVLGWDGTALVVSDEVTGMVPRTGLELAAGRLGVAIAAIDVVSGTPSAVHRAVVAGATAIGLTTQGHTAPELRAAGAVDVVQLHDLAGAFGTPHLLSL